MALILQNYREPGAYSTIVPNPTTVTAAGPPIVAILGQALRGTYDPQLFFNADDAQSMYGVATKSNPLPLGIQIAFENGASRVLGINVEPTNSKNAYLGIPGLPGTPIASHDAYTSTLPQSGFLPAASDLLDPVTNQPVNVDGTVAGVFYVQDFNPTTPDPALNTTPQATQQAFGLSASGNLLQYIKFGSAPLLNGVQQVPYSNSNMVRIVVPAVVATAPPDASSVQTFLMPNSSIAQGDWNQLMNAFALANAINSTPNAPIYAQILVPDALDAAQANPVPGYTDVLSAVAAGTIATVSTTTGTITSVNDAYAYAIAAGVLRISAIEPGTEHEIVAGLFAASTFDAQTGDKPFGLKTAFAGTSSTNPYFIFNNGVDGVVTNESYIDAINNKLSTVRADVIVVLNTDVTLQEVIKEHVAFMSSHDERNERIALVSGPISELYTTSIANAQALQGGAGAQRMVYIWPTGGYRQDPILRTLVTLDGTYIAAACAGILTSQDAATPLTRKKIAGFTDITTKTSRTQMNNIAQNGITVIENDPRQGLRVRHGITCDPSTQESQEISVVRQLDYTVQTVRDLLDTNVVASKITSNTLPAVQTMTKNQLQLLETANIIFGYQNVSARINPNDARQIDVRFTVKPTYPCNWIEITLSVTSALDN